MSKSQQARQRQIVAQYDRLVTFFTQAVRKYPNNPKFREILIEVSAKREREASLLKR